MQTPTKFINPKSIVVPPERQRSSFEKIEELAASIKHVGQIQPIVVRGPLLIAGERRLRAILHLDLPQIEVKDLNDMPEAQAHLIELIENVQREELSWQDRAKAVLRLRRLMKEQDPKSTLEDVSKVINISIHNINRICTVGEAIMKAPDGELAQMPSWQTAYNALNRQVSRAADAEVEAIIHGVGAQSVVIQADEISLPAPREDSPSTSEDEPTISPPTSTPEPPAIPTASSLPPVPILNTSFLQWAAAYSGPRFNLIHCDFPYGIDHHKSEQGGVSGERESSDRTAYEDTPEIYFELLSGFLKYKDNFLAASAHIVFWFSMKYYDETKRLFESEGFDVNPTPLIWYKSDNTGILPDAQRGPRQVYETALLISRGDRKIVRAVGNVKAFPGAKDDMIHHSEKPREMLKHFLSMLCDGTTSFLDPTCGSANSLCVAHSLGADTILGIELDEEIHKKAVSRFRSVQ